MTKARSNAVAAAAKGDLTVGTGTNLSGILPVSATNGDTIVADASTATGLRYQSGYNGNAVINGGMDIWQRGTPIAYGINAVVYAADRWSTIRVASPSNATASRQTSSLTGTQYCSRIARTAGDTLTAALFYSSSLESADCYRLAGQTVTMSFFARAGANFSAASNTLTYRIDTGTGTDQNLLTGYTGGASTLLTTATLTTSFQRFQASVAIPAGTTELGPVFTYTPTGTAGAADYFEVTGVQIELGSVATNFKRAGGTIQGETSACQRYFYLHASGNTIPISTTGNYSTTLAIGWLGLPVTMRIAPTLVAASGSAFYSIDVGGTALTFNAPTIGQVSTTSVRLDAAVTGAVVGHAGYLRTSSASASIAFNSEL